MKYLYLILRHLFPRRRWKFLGKTNVYEKGQELPIAVILTMEDQFGNIKTKKVKS